MNDYLKQRMLDKQENPGYDLPMKNDAQKHPHPLFIVFSGKKQTGKDTAALMVTKMLVKSGKTVASSAFANALKDTAINVLGLDRTLVYGSNEEKETPTHVQWDTFPDEIRLKYSLTFEENFGFVYDSNSLYPEGYAKAIRQGKRTHMRSGPMTVRDVLQVMGTDIFRTMFDGNVWTNAVFSRQWDTDVVLITDCRFPNEKSITEEHFGVIIRLERDTGLTDAHLSETALDGYDFEHLYVNNDSLDDLEAFMHTTLKTLGLL